MSRRVSIPSLLLFCLEKAVQGGECVLETSQDLREWMYEVYGTYPKTRDKYTISRAIKRLRERGLLEEEGRKEGEIILQLTQRGRRIALLTGDNNTEEWDGRWRIVVFDIPEQKRALRQVLRGRLKSWGFVLWQKSVWASKKNVTNELRDLIRELELDRWVLVLESDNVGINK